MATERRVLVDGGQTGIRLRVVDGTSVSEHTAAPLRTDHPVIVQIAAAVADLVRSLGISVDAVAAGVSGLTPGACRPEELLTGLTEVGVGRVALAHDSVTAYLAANGFELGAVTAVGTGVVTLGVGSAGVARVDGWGNLVGDAGSAYWIGRAGLDAALRAFDGRGPATELESAAVREFGPLPELYMVLQGAPDRVSRTAGFARAVDEAARHDDAVAIDISRRASAELATSVAAALGRSGHRTDSSPRVSWLGKVLSSNELIRSRFIELIRGEVPHCVVAPPFGEPLDGVALLLDMPTDHPLSSQVGHAG